MAKRPSELYNPGELERTRNNIGWVTGEEARRISELLGGDVGVERTPENVGKKYKKIQDLNRRKSDRIISENPRFNTDHTLRGSEHPDGKAAEQREQPRYRDRLRMDFLAARPEHAVKTLPNAISSVFAFHTNTRDYVHPRLIIDGDSLFLNRVENLVIAVRGLYAQNRRHPTNRLKTPFYRQILDIIKSWDIEGLHTELNRLQISPRRLTFRYCGTLARKLFGPIYRFIDVDAVYHLRNALKRLYDLNILSLPKGHVEVERVKAYYHQAIWEIEHVFGPLKYRLFPFLMKLCSHRYHDTDRFYLEERAEILAFLSLDEKDLISMPPPEIPQKEDPVEVEETDETTEPVIEAAKNQKGLEVLERLFPKAGWDRLDEFPDLYPHLHPLLLFPKGFELIRPDDPLQQTLALVSILQELFYGFRHIQFGVLYQSVGSRLGEKINQIIEGWRMVRDEFVSRSYLPQLYEYCREVEHNPGFAATEYGVKRQRDMQWQMKEYLLPHYVVHRGAAPDVSQSIPQLHELANDLLDLLSVVSVDVAGSNRDDIRSVKNPWDRFIFDIGTPLTRRLEIVMRRFHEEPNNANLLLYTFSILTLLDSLVNDESSYFYPFPTEPMYRTEFPGKTTPHYEAQTIDTDTLFREASRDAPLREPPPESRKVSIIDELTGAFNTHGLRRFVEREVGRLRKDNIPFSVVTLAPMDFEEYYREHGEEAGVSLLTTLTSIIKEQIREHRDIPGRLESAVFAVLLPDTATTEGTHLALRLLASCVKSDNVPNEIAIGVFRVHRTWSTDRTFRIAHRAIQAAQSFPAPSISLYDEKANRFVPLHRPK
jgi:diguanylate cyclase (GGDEF)-like protein